MEYMHGLAKSPPPSHDAGFDAHRHFSNLPDAPDLRPEPPLPLDAVLPGEDDEDMLSQHEMSQQFDGQVAVEDMVFGFRSLGTVSDSGNLSEGAQEGSGSLEGFSNRMQGAPVATAVPPLQVGRSKPHAHGDYAARDSGRGSVQSLRMPVVHEEGESIAGSSTVGEEQPPAPGAVSVSGRQVRSLSSCACVACMRFMRTPCV